MIALLLSLTQVSPVGAAAFRLAVMGDSISAGSGVSGGSPNWVAQLNATGKFAMQNKAVGGATTNSVISGQLSTVKSLASQSKLDGSVLIIGGNDVTSNIDTLLNDPQAFANAYTANVVTILSGVAASGPAVHQVFGNIPDITVTPLVQSQAASNGITSAQLQQLSAAIALANNQADAYALAHGIPVLDLYSLSRAVTVPYTLGGYTFTTFTAPDGYHPAIWGQGLFANIVDTAFNLQWGLSLPLLSDQQIVRNAGRTPNNLTTYFNVQPFVLLPVPEPATAVLALISVAGLAWHRRRTK